MFNFTLLYKRLQTIAIAIFSGVLLGTSWSATGSLTPLVFIGFVPLLFLEYQISTGKREGNILGLSFLSFFVFNLITTWWIYCVDEELITKLISVGTPVILNPLFMATAFTLFSNAKKRLGEKRGYWAFVFFWLGFEYLHLNWSISDPWLTLGNVFSNRPSWVQWYEYTGILGGSLWILLINLTVFFVLKKYKEERSFSSLKKIIMVAFVLLSIPLSFSLVRYYNYAEKENPVNITVIQPNIDPYDTKFTSSDSEQLETLLQLAEENRTDKTDYILGPETALPYSIWISKIKETPLYEQLKAFNTKYPNTNLVLGASLGKIYSNKNEITPTSRRFGNIERWYDHYNSAIQIDQSDSIQIYHKSKLVLGVESMPFPQLFMHFQEIIFNLGGTVGSLGLQKERSVFKSSTSNLKIAPVICWESIYGEFVGEFVQKGANLIFILTNDGWWAETPGHLQHLNYARLRAIETRRSVARSANTGVSCFINQRGDISKPTKWWVKTAINETLNANDKITFYVIYGDYIGRLASFFAALLLLWVFVKKYSINKK